MLLAITDAVMCASSHTYVALSMYSIREGTMYTPSLLSWVLHQKSYHVCPVREVIMCTQSENIS